MNYQKLFDYMSKEHGVDLLETDMIEIVRIVNEMQQKQPDEPQPKTIRQWFEELPEPYRHQALKRIHNNSIQPSLSQAVKGGLLWWQDEENGGEYWASLHNELLKQNK